MPTQTRPMNYWFFLIPFGMAAMLGMTGLVAGEIWLPENAGGQAGLLAMYRSLGPMTVIWLVLSVWAWHRIMVESDKQSRRNSPS